MTGYVKQLQCTIHDEKGRQLFAAAGPCCQLPDVSYGLTARLKSMEHSGIMRHTAYGSTIYEAIWEIPGNGPALELLEGLLKDLPGH